MSVWRPALIVILITGPIALSGCFGIFRAEVPSSFLTEGWKRTDTDGGKRWLGLAAEWATVTYEVRPTPTGAIDNGPYPASLSVMSIETPGRLSREEVVDKLDRQLRANAREAGILIDNASRRSGERNLDSGIRTLYFTYEAEISGSSGLFDPGRAARVIGEVGYDERSKITVVAVGLAQTQGGGAVGGSFTNRLHWARLVADPSGSIEGQTRDDGLIFNVRSHD